MDSSRAEIEAYSALQCYTLAHGGAEFLHQHVVDAWAAQHADGNTKPVGLTFALIGLHLHVDKGYTGRQVQQVHMSLSKRKKRWPLWTLPVDRGSMTVIHVLAAPAGPERDRLISAWCGSVWQAFGENHGAVADLLCSLGGTR